MRLYLPTLILLASLLFVPFAKAQTSYEDSLHNVMNDVALAKASRANAALALGRMYWHSDSEKTKKYAQQALTFGKEANADSISASAYLVLGVGFYLAKEHTQADTYFEQGLALAKTLKKPTLKGNAYNFLGLSAWRQSRYDKALNYFKKALQEGPNAKGFQAMANGNIALIYAETGDFSQALAYYHKVFNLHREVNNTLLMGITHMNMGVGFSEQLISQDSAIFYLKSAEKYLSRSKNEYQVANLYTNFSQVYLRKEDYAKATTYAYKALTIADTINDANTQAAAWSLLAEVYRAEGKTQDLERTLHKVRQLAQQANNLDREVKAVDALAQFYGKKQQYQKAFEFLSTFKALEDSLQKLQQQEKVLEVRTKYESEKKEKENELLRQKNALSQSQLRIQQLLLFGGVALLLLTLAVVILLLRRNRLKQRTNKLLSRQKEEILRKNEELQQQKEEIIMQRNQLEEQNLTLAKKDKKVMDSIRYAKTIQEAILPFSVRMDSIFKSYFVLYLPKDIVSGDFYWVSRKDNFTFAAAVDCTGHGVPGAFMSMIAYALLNDIVLDKSIVNPKDILSTLAEKVVIALKQEKGTNTDGMDVALVRISDESKEGKSVVFAGAKRPLWYILPEATEVNTLKGDRQSIGGKLKLPSFTEQPLTLPAGTKLYLMSDGYIDQNNEKRERIGSRGLRDALSKIASQSLKRQQKALEELLKAHKGQEEQRDDILVLGIEL